MPWKRRVAVFSLHLLGCAPEPPSRTPCETLVVATWNVRRLFDSRCDSGDCGPTRAEDRLPPDEVEASVRRVASAVRALDADVVVLEEIENRALLDRIVEAHGGTLSAAIGESPAPGSIDVAVIARVPIRRVRHHVGVTLALPDGRTTTPTRDLLEVELATAPRPVTVVGALQIPAARRSRAATCRGPLRSRHRGRGQGSRRGPRRAGRRPQRRPGLTDAAPPRG